MAANASPQQDPVAANMLARNLIVQRGLKMTQNIFSTTVNPNTQNVFNIPPRNVGLILGFWVTVDVAITTTDIASPLTFTPFGAANVLSNVQYIDLQNNTRINVPGWYLAMLNSARNGAPWLAARTNTAYPVQFGNNDPSVAQAPALDNNTVTVSYTYWVPLAYSNTDLRGSVYANVTQATQTLQLTFNLNGFFADTDTTSPVNAVYAASDIAGPTIGNITVNVYQVYYDQLPSVNGQMILPYIDLATLYLLNYTSVTNLTVNNDYPIPYANFRAFLSTLAVYANGVEMNTSTDINFWKLQAANFTNIFNVPPRIVKAWERQFISDDFPPGTYYFDHRSKPLETIQYGNLELVINPKVVNANATLYMGYEQFALLNNITGATSLPGGAG
jgi:hypothetical protein